MRHYATLFDSKYLPQGLALYESLKQNSAEPFFLHILALDPECELSLRCMELDYTEIDSIDEMEERVNWIKEAKANRTHREFCWMMASVFTEDVLRQNIAAIRIEDTTYLDADLFFFSNPSPVFAQIGERSIAITPHRFPDNPQKARLEKSGKYNVGFVHFKNTEAGRDCLSKWAANVRERCSAEVGCGDQIYLDSFEADYPGEVAILGHGVNAGPWNLSGYEVCMYDGQIFLDRHPLIAYHMHEYQHDKRLTNYALRDIDKELIYKPYIAAVNRAKELIASVHISA